MKVATFDNEGVARCDDAHAHPQSRSILASIGEVKQGQKFPSADWLVGLQLVDFGLTVVAHPSGAYISVTPTPPPLPLEPVVVGGLSSD